MIEVGPASGGVELRLDPRLEEVLSSVPDWLRSVGRTGTDPAADRLTPHAYSDDPEADAEFDRLMGPELENGRNEDRERYVAALQRAASGPTSLSEEEVFAVLRVLDEARLAVAARLGIDSDFWQASPEMEDAEEARLYEMLGWVQAELIDAASAAFLGDA